jgi:hypothetical protein
MPDMTTTAEFLDVDQQAPPTIQRDRWGRPKIVPPDGGDARPYTRASTLGKALDDEAGLTFWKQRMTAIGVAKRRDLILAVNAHATDKQMMGELVEQAMDAAESGAAATSGTALHQIMDDNDQGRTPYVPDEYHGDLAAYQRVRRGLEVVRSETFVVDDELQVAGTYDRLYRLRFHATTPDGTVLEPGTLVIGDLKTGADIKFGHTSWACQLSVYAHGLRYDPATDARLEREPINQDWGLIVHVPVMKGVAQLLWIDLRKGRELAKLAYTVRSARKTKTMTPCDLSPTWTDQIATTDRLDVLRALWGSCTEEQAMTAEIEAAFKARAKELAA